MRPVDLYGDFGGNVFCDLRDLLRLQFRRKDESGKPHGRRCPCAVRAVDIEPDVAPQRRIRQNAPQRGNQTQIPHDQRVRAGPCGEDRAIKNGGEVFVRGMLPDHDSCPTASDAAIPQAFCQLLGGKNLPNLACVGNAEAHIDTIRAALHGGDHILRATGGRQQLKHNDLDDVCGCPAECRSLGNELLYNRMPNKTRPFKSG